MARKRRQTPAQRRASIKNLKKARAALRRRRPYRNWSSVGPYRARRGKKRRGVKGHRRRTNPAARLLDRWESRGGRYWVEIRADGDGVYSVVTDNSRGTFYSLEDARAAARDQVSYAPSKMRKVNRRTSNFASGMRYIHNLPPRARTTRRMANPRRRNPSESVIVRIWKGRGTDWYNDGIILFPNQDAGRGLIQSWMRVGQHGGADYQTVIAKTRPATGTEAMRLIELYRETYPDNVRYLYRRRRSRRR